MNNSIYIINDINNFHKKIREVSYWHFICINNEVAEQQEFYFNFSSNNKFRKELSYLIAEKESYLILEKYLKLKEEDHYIDYSDLDSLIKETSFRICCNIISKMSNLNLVDVLWDPDKQNFCFKINSNFVEEDIVTPQSFLKNVYNLSIKHLNLKNHYKDIKKLR